MNFCRDKCREKIVYTRGSVGLGLLKAWKRTKGGPVVKRRETRLLSFSHYTQKADEWVLENGISILSHFGSTFFLCDPLWCAPFSFFVWGKRKDKLYLCTSLIWSLCYPWHWKQSAFVNLGKCSDLYFFLGLLVLIRGMHGLDWAS